MTNEQLLGSLKSSAVVMIEQWLRFDCTLEESFAVWEKNTTAGPKVKEAVKVHFLNLGYSF